METIELPSEVVRHIETLSRKTGKARNDLIREAILTYLEDREDAMVAAERLKNPGKRISLEELAHKYDLAD